MINHIHIRNLALIPELDLDLHQGLTVLTGETGAGKSLFTDALGLALGNRADTGLIRQGCNKSEVNVGFSLDGLTHVHAWLDEQALTHEANDNECVIRRTLSSDGRSRAYINGSPVSLQQLRYLGAQLVNLQGQQAHLSLMHTPQQRQLLDQFAQHPELLEEVAQHYKNWQVAYETFQGLEKSHAVKNERLQLLSFQRDELLTLALQDNELSVLETQHQRLASAREIQDTLKTAIEQLEEAENTSALHTLNQATLTLQHAQTVDSRLQEAYQMLAEALILTTEASRSCQDILQTLHDDPEQLQWVNDRLGYIYDTARKYRITVTELPTLIHNTLEEYDTLMRIDLDMDEQAQRVEEQQRIFQAAAQRLTTQRILASNALADELTQRLQALGMASARFDIRVTPTSEALSVPTPHGQDTIEWHFTANTGIPPQPLADIASGGELSRIVLAIHSVIARDTRTPTLIFDEADTGVGGKVADFIGKLLKELALTHQILCITHLPQVARYGAQHICISKQMNEHSTETVLTPLTQGTQRIDELARMLGGDEITEKTRDHAQEMLQRVSTGY